MVVSYHFKTTYIKIYMVQIICLEVESVAGLRMGISRTACCTNTFPGRSQIQLVMQLYTNRLSEEWSRHGIAESNLCNFPSGPFDEKQSLEMESENGYRASTEKYRQKNIKNVMGLVVLGHLWIQLLSQRISWLTLRNVIVWRGSSEMKKR